MPDPALALDPDDQTSACYGMELSNADEEDGPVCAAWRASTGRACGCDGAPEPACDPACPEGTQFSMTETFFADGDFPVMCFMGLFGLSKFAGDCTIDLVNQLGSCCVGIGTDVPISAPTNESTRTVPPVSIQGGTKPDVTPASASILPLAHFAALHCLAVSVIVWYL